MKYRHLTFSFFITILLSCFSSAELPKFPRHVSLTQPSGLEMFFADKDASLTIKYVYSIKVSERRDQTIVFANYRQNATRSEPVIVFSEKGNWFIKRFSDLSQLGWEYVAVNRHNGDVIAIMDCQVESPAYELSVFSSTGNLQDWKFISEVKKPTYEAWFYDLELNENGIGILTVWLASSSHSSIKDGFYRYRTLDGGKTWSRPQFEAVNVYHKMYEPSRQIEARSFEEFMKLF